MNDGAKAVRRITKKNILCEKSPLTACGLFNESVTSRRRWLRTGTTQSSPDRPRRTTGSNGINNTVLQNLDDLEVRLHVSTISTETVERKLEFI